ncbi:MAG: hypothetical protein L0Y56_19210 [Nitrospira sp.]|nr:hypothetical protein [Nitrospira sp.]
MKTAEISPDSERAQAAATARWLSEDTLEKRLAFDWQGLPLEKAQNVLAKLHKECQKGSRIVQERLGTGTAKTFICKQCGKEYDTRPAAIYARRDANEVITNHFICSPRCNVIYQQKTRGGVVK